MVVVYHGGTPATHDFERSYAAKNSGSVGYYVTTSLTQASSYGPVHCYVFDAKACLDTYQLSKEEALALSRLSKYYENWSEDPNDAQAVEALCGQSAADAMLDAINATGLVRPIIDFFVNKGFTHYNECHDKAHKRIVYTVIDIKALTVFVTSVNEIRSAFDKLHGLSSQLDDPE